MVGGFGGVSWGVGVCLPGSLLSCWAQLKTSSGPAMSHRSNLSCRAMRTLIGSKLSPSGSSTIAPVKRVWSASIGGKVLLFVAETLTHLWQLICFGKGM
jgi:hypothetical protein